jgi:hypothetical protein
LRDQLSQNEGLVIVAGSGDGQMERFQLEIRDHFKKEAGTRQSLLRVE